MIKAIIILLCFIISGIDLAHAEQILTTVRSDAGKTIFDGRWTFLQEWKSTSEDKILFDDGGLLVIKTGHDYNNLYVLLDFVSERSSAKSADFGMVCIDSNFGKETKPQNDDYCFMTSLGSNYPITLQGGSMLGKNNHFTKIENHPNLIAVGGMSGMHDRYSQIPHTTYEFKIPIEIFGASDMYGFYVVAYDANTNQVYSWPQNTATEKFPYVPPPSKWGELISPDKSIPEFHWPILVLLPAIFLVVYLTRIKQTSFNQQI